jgi:hypothetical protein
VVIEKSLNRPKKGMPASWRRSSGGATRKWARFESFLQQLKSMQMEGERALSIATDFVMEQSRRPVVQAAATGVVLWVVREPAMQAATVIGQFLVGKLQGLLPARRKKVSPYQLPPQYNKRSLKSVLEGTPHSPERSRWQWPPRLPWSVRQSPDATRVDRARKVDVGALSKAQHLSPWDKLSMKLSRAKRDYL